MCLYGLDSAHAQSAPPTPLFKLDGHTVDVSTVAWSPDGKRVASASNTQVKLWDAEAGKEISTFAIKGTNVYGMAFSPDGKRLAVGISQKVQFLDATTGKEQMTAGSNGQFLFRLAFSPDGTQLAAASGHNGDHAGVVHIWNAADGKAVRILSGHTEPVLNVAYSRDGKWLASVSGSTSGVKAGEVRIWEAATGKAMLGMRGHAANVYAVAFSPDGRRIASGSGPRTGPGKGELKLWETATGKEVLHAAGDFGTVYALAFSPDGRRLVIGCSDGTIRFIDAVTGQEIHKIAAHTNNIYSLAFSPDAKKLVSAGVDRSVKIWDAAAGRPANLAKIDLPPDQLEARWAELAGDDAGKAYRAVWTLAAAADQSLPYLRRHLRPAPCLNPEQEKDAKKLIRELDDRKFPIRQKATAELARFDEAVAPLLREALLGAPPLSLDARRRVLQLLDDIANPIASPERMRAVRAIEVLESIGTPAARELLRELAAGLPGAKLTVEAEGALARVKK